MVFTPHAPIQRLLRWPYTRVTAAVLDHAIRTSPTSNAERDEICRRFPRLATRLHVVPTGVDGVAIRAARPLDGVGDYTVLTVARLERHKRVDRTVAAMAAVAPAYRLAVIGAGSALRGLVARAADLRIGARVDLVGPVSDDLLYRWLRTARVVVSVAEQEASGVPVMEALSAGAPVVATDIPVHREAAARVPDAPVVFVPTEPSPLRIADAIGKASALRPSSSAALAVPCWETVVEDTCALYDDLLVGASRRNGSSPTAAGIAHVNGNGRGPSVALEA